MVNMSSASVSSRKGQKMLDSSVSSANRNSVMMDEYSDEDEEFQIAEAEQEVRSGFKTCARMLSVYKGIQIIVFCSFSRHTRMGFRVMSREQVDNYYLSLILVVLILV